MRTWTKVAAMAALGAVAGAAAQAGEERSAYSVSCMSPVQGFALPLATDEQQQAQSLSDLIEKYTADYISRNLDRQANRAERMS
jgi:hypothetical protein